MQKRLNCFLGILCVSILISCGKEAQEVDPNYVGYWLGQGSCEPGMRIKANGDGTYKATRQVSDCDNMDHRGTARIQGDKLKIGSKHLHIDSAPTATAPHSVHMSLNGEFTSTMQLVLEGDTYYRLDGY
ncbi:MAG: hypothetical protein ABI599_16025 [Flavobacteriales bacterium]